MDNIATARCCRWKSRSLTGLPNRREFIDVVSNVLRSDRDLSVFMLDIDFFKKVNDSFGHDVGDEVLRVLARVGTNSLKNVAVFARWGGEEFVAALPGYGVNDAAAIAENLRMTSERGEFDHRWRLGKPVPFTVSIGVAGRTADDDDVEALVKRADVALYKAKNAGRNRVELAL